MHSLINDSQYYYYGLVWRMELICFINCIKIILNYLNHYSWHSPIISQTPEKQLSCRGMLLRLWRVAGADSSTSDGLQGQAPLSLMGYKKLKNSKWDSGQDCRYSVVIFHMHKKIHYIQNSNLLVPESITSRQTLFIGIIMLQHLQVLGVKLVIKVGKESYGWEREMPTEAESQRQQMQQRQILNYLLNVVLKHAGSTVPSQKTLLALWYTPAV